MQAAQPSASIMVSLYNFLINYKTYDYKTSLQIIKKHYLEITTTTNNHIRTLEIAITWLTQFSSAVRTVN